MPTDLLLRFCAQESFLKAAVPLCFLNETHVICGLTVLELLELLQSRTDILITSVYRDHMPWREKKMCVDLFG